MDLFDELRSRHATDIFHKNRLFEVVVKIFTNLSCVLICKRILVCFSYLALEIKKKRMKWIHEIRYYFERHGFDVFSRLSDRLGIAVKNIRLFFVYFTFVTLGVSFGLYLILAFLLKLKDMVYTKRTSVFDL